MNKLSLNATKTELIFFHSARHPLDYGSISIKMNGFKLTPVDFIKYLGMYLDKYLDWNVHINDLKKKLSRANGVLSKLRYNVPIKMCIQVYYAIFYSYLNIGCNVWGFTSERNIDDIQVLQNKCVRIMTFAPFNSNTDQSFIDLGLLKVREVIKLNQLKVVYDSYDKKLPDDLMSLFIPGANPGKLACRAKVLDGGCFRKTCRMGRQLGVHRVRGREACVAVLLGRCGHTHI